jgi:predicted transposase YdaD
LHKEYIDAQKFFDRESIEVVTEMVTSKELKAYIQTNKDNKGDDLDMCKAITDLIEDGREEGKTEGKIEGKIETLADLVNDGDMTVEKAASKMQITVEEFLDQAEALGFKLASN